MVLSEEEKRWAVVLVTSNKTVAPVLRDFVKQGMHDLYTSLNIHLNGLTPPCSLSTLTYNPATLNDPKLKPLKFQNINNNQVTHGTNKAMYTYNVISPADLAKLYLPGYLANFSAFDNSLDMGAILRLIGCTKPAPIFSSPNPFICIQTLADDVKDNVRNKGAHFNADEWTQIFFDQCFVKLEALVKGLGLPVANENTTVDKLSDWKTQGNYNKKGI